MIIAGTVAGIAVIGGVAWWMLSSKLKAPVPQPSGTTPVTITIQNPPVPTPAPADSAPSSSPSICGVPSAGDSVIHIVDRSGCTQQAFQQMADACLKSAENLGSDRQFQIAVWNTYLLGIDDVRQVATHPLRDQIGDDVQR